MFTLEGESNDFAHDLPFQPRGKAKREIVPSWERDTYTQQTKDPFRFSMLSNLASRSYCRVRMLAWKAVVYIGLWLLRWGW